MTVDDHVERLAADLDVPPGDIRRDLTNLLEYNVPLEEATESIRRKYQDNTTPDQPTPRTIADLTPGTGAVTLTACILTVGKRSIRYQGEDRVITEGELADPTGKIPYTAWDTFALEPGQTVTVTNATVREWNDTPELNLSQNTTVTPTDDPLETPYEPGGDANLTDLQPGDRGRTIDATIIDLERRTVDGRDGPTPILSGVIADETARLPFTDWNPHDTLEPDQSYRIENVYVREFRGVPSVNLTEYTTITPLPDPIPPSPPPRLTIADALATNGAYDIEITGHIVGVRDGSGLIQRCPECGRPVQKTRCRTHGEVEPVDDLRIKAILDDGTGNLTAIFDTDQTAALYGGNVDDARAAAQEAMDQDVVGDTIATIVTGRDYRLRGNLSIDEYGANLVVTDYHPVDTTPAEAATNALDRRTQ